MSGCRSCGYVVRSTSPRSPACAPPGWPSPTPGAPIVVVDLSAVTFMDVAGVGLLAALVNRQHVHGGKVQLRSVPAQVGRVLELTGLAAAIPVEPPQPERPAAGVIDLRRLEGQRQLRD